jgi:hypothetical protein
VWLELPRIIRAVSAACTRLSMRGQGVGAALERENLALPDLFPLVGIPHSGTSAGPR